MPRRTLFSSAERTDLLRPPNGESELARHYSFSETDLALIRQRRGDANRLGFAAQLCLLRYPGQGLMLKGAVEEVPTAFLHWIGSQLGIDPVCWPGYFLREATRREHLLELRSYLKLRPFGPGRCPAVPDISHGAGHADGQGVLTEKGKNCTLRVEAAPERSKFVRFGFGKKRPEVISAQIDVFPAQR